jgi:lysyl-tRNA synthetase class 2
MCLHCIAVVGTPVGKDSGPLSINATELPQILTPALHLLPTKLEDQQTRIKNRHVDLLVNKNAADTIRLRSHIIQHVREFLLQDGFLEVQTPIIVDKASGAAARPFTTVATEFLDKELALRIAPEIWLKRLILGGMDRVFEIGPAFRNEGLDATHNPEFTTCEFYKSFAELEDLMLMTENMVSGIAARVNSLSGNSLETLPTVDASLLATPFKRVEFIPAIEAAMGETLPDLAAEDATESLLDLFTKYDISVPRPQTLPRLLDKLASVYIEPQCEEPTYIIHHPACMAPLSKSFLDPGTNQLVSARAELFTQQTEIANMYEEENSPFEQRTKLVQQALLKDEETGSDVDESYLKALEWGLPPTGGWGCGIDRMCMLFSGSSRISDVLAFGSLRNVVSLGKTSEEKAAVEKQEV